MLRIFLVGRFVLLALGALPAPALAQRARPGPDRPPRLISLGRCSPHQLTVLPGGLVRIGCDDELAEIDPSGRLRKQDFPGVPVAISRDGKYLAGFIIGETGYAEVTWWELGNPIVEHRLLPHDNGILSGIVHAPLGVVVVGSRYGAAIDIHPPQTWEPLPHGPVASGSDSAYSVSADGSVYAGTAGGVAVRWVNRVLEELDNPSGTGGLAYGTSPDGSNYAGEIWGTRPVVWLARDGLARRMLLDPSGAVFSGSALGVLDDGLVFGEGGSATERFGWIWRPDFGSDNVLRIDAWLSSHGLPAAHVESVRDVRPAKGSYHFSLYGGEYPWTSWYAETPR